jgi:6-phosphogluconolactonase
VFNDFANVNWYMQMQLAKNIDELSHQFAQWLVTYIEQTLAGQNRFTIALSGGGTPKKLYELLASSSFKNQIDWQRLHFFWGDERFVPGKDERNNSKMAFATLLDHVPVVKEHVHRIRTDMDPQESAAAYERLLHDYFDNQPYTFDLVLLGLGDNAHTLSLFPGYPVIKENKKWVTAFYLQEQEMTRITLTAPVINESKRVAFLVSGGDKAAAVYHTIASEHDPDLYPAQIIQPFHSEVYWFCDEAAAADL